MNKYILDFWRACREQGRPERPVWVLVHDAGSTQPQGYEQGFSANKRVIRKHQMTLGGNIRLCKLLP